MKIDKKLIKELTDYLNEFNLTELEYGNNDLKIKVSKSISTNSYQTIDKRNSPKNITEDINKSGKVLTGKQITSPIIGTAYLAPEPGAKKFVEVGKKIKKGDTIMIVEAMKTMNHVPATSDGTVKEICVQDGSPVEFGQTLVILD
jgi:Biotin carboxyl carrier protein